MTREPPVPDNPPSMSGAPTSTDRGFRSRSREVTRIEGFSDAVFAFAVTLNGVLLFVVLFFVYPLKFLFVNLVRAFAGQSTQVMMPDGRLHPAIAPDEAGSLMVIYSSGYVAIFLILWLLYGNALRHRTGLGLSPVEELITRAGRASI